MAEKDPTAVSEWRAAGTCGHCQKAISTKGAGNDSGELEWRHSGCKRPSLTIHASGDFRILKHEIPADAKPGKQATAETLAPAVGPKFRAAVELAATRLATVTFNAEGDAVFAPDAPKVRKAAKPAAAVKQAPVTVLGVSQAPATTEPKTHEAFIHAVRAIVLNRLEGDAKTKLGDAKLVYGAGSVRGARGVTFFGAWTNGAPGHDFLEVCAAGEESPVQIAGTTIHELGHCLAGNAAGHGKAWKEACRVLGLVQAEAAGQSYEPAHFDASVWSAVEALPAPSDGKPTFGAAAGGIVVAPRPCPLGIGTKGGKSRGAGSGSRLRLWVCSCEPVVKVRVASDDFQATCGRCGEAFKRPEGK